MTLKKIAIFPIQSKNLDIEQIRFAKTLTLFIHLSLESFLYLNSNIIKLISSNGNIVPEDIYISYNRNELMEKYNDQSIDYIIFFDLISKKDKYIITYYIHNNPEKKLINSNSYILSMALFEDIYKNMINDILNKTQKTGYFIDNYISNFEIFKSLKEIILNDDIFFHDVDNIKYIEQMEKIHKNHKELAILRYIVRKILNTNNIFFVNKIIQKLRSNEENNYYNQFLLATTLMELKQYKEALKIFNSLKKDSLFLKLRGAVIFTLKAEANLKLNNLLLARRNIMKAIEFNITMKDTYELFLEIMYKSKFFMAFKSYINLEKFNSIKSRSSIASFWIAKYYSEISVNNEKAISYIENFKYSPEIIFIYLKILYRISMENKDESRLKTYIMSLYKKEILKITESDYEDKDNIENIKMFIKAYINFNSKENLRDIFIKEKIEIKPYNEMMIDFSNIEKIIFNQIYEENHKKSKVINDLLFFILKDYDIAIKNLKSSNQELYFYASALINPSKRSKLLKKAFKINKNINILNKIIIYYSETKNYIMLSYFLKKRKKFIADDYFEKFYTIKKYIIAKNYKKSFTLINSMEDSYKENNLAEDLIDSIRFLKAEIYFKTKKYDEMLKLMKTIQGNITKNSKFNYMKGYVLSKIHNNRRGLFYLQKSYNLNPNKNLHKELIKEYKKYGIEYMKE